MVQEDTDRMYNLVVNQLRHSEKCMSEYWGRQETIWLFYYAQKVNCLQLLTDYEKPYTGGGIEGTIPSKEGGGTE